METAIRAAIERECAKLIDRFHYSIRTAKNLHARYGKRTGLTPGVKTSYEPKYWSLHPQFNPFLCRSRCRVLAHALTRKLQSETYAPVPCLVQQFPKPTGGYREITLFSVPDAAIANRIYRMLISRNGSLFSPHAYAFRLDRNTHHAVQHLYQHVAASTRLYLLEYDFSKYFDNIRHDYVFDVMSRWKLKVSPSETKLIRSFLECPRANGISDYSAGAFKTPVRGIPQGNSLSLFLANVACLELDRKIEATGATFARYADDTVILCDTYDNAHRCAQVMLSHELAAGTPINTEKSVGISLLTTEREAEIRSKRAFDFLGHSIAHRRVSVATRSVTRIKKRIGTIIYQHLLLYPWQGKYSKKRIGPKNLDWDLVTCIMAIRGYLYGRVSESDVTSSLASTSHPLKLTKGLLSYYPLVDDPSIWRELDGWLVNVLRRALRQRQKLIKSAVPNYKLPKRHALLCGSWYTSTLALEVQLPSFVRAWRYVRKCLNVYGLQHFPSVKYVS